MKKDNNRWGLNTGNTIKRQPQCMGQFIEPEYPHNYQGNFNVNKNKNWELTRVHGKPIVRAYIRDGKFGQNYPSLRHSVKGLDLSTGGLLPMRKFMWDEFCKCEDDYFVLRYLDRNMFLRGLRSRTDTRIEKRYKSEKYKAKRGKKPNRIYKHEAC